ncbi:putative cobaltochelatase [Desulfogranum japonicum]|uniref:putative cobaltochelatase n=1 Tax=Desulfogranum japonicum TaxID=231447 RepID=UPI0003FF8B0A|nr:putative cobaltochelatase [Desulfogranum japonicum]
MFTNLYPLAAIVGQDQLKQALLLAAVNPLLSGVLIRGEKGTAKSTMVRGLSQLLPELDVVQNCPFGCSPRNGDVRCTSCSQENAVHITVKKQVPLVTLPLNGTEDRVAGGIDFPKSLQQGKVVCAPGLLAQANRGILYVDEVNLLDDHLVDLILDASASGINRVEREGLSFTHPASFLLVGTMNPEEGELRPQLLDRFGLCVDLKGEEDPEKRVELMLRRESFDADPTVFIHQYERQTDMLRQQIVQARQALDLVQVSKYMRGFISELCVENNVAGHRADLVLEQASRAIAALEGAHEVTFDHIQQIAPLVLLHRRREAEPPPPPPPPEQDNQEQEQQEESPQEENQEQQQNEQESGEQDQGQQPPQAEESPDEQSEQGEEEQPVPMPQVEKEDQVFAIGSTFRVKAIVSAKDRVFRRGSGRRSRTRVAQKNGRYIKSTMHQNGDLALDATLRAAAPYQKQRGSQDGMAVHIHSQDIRGKIREKRIGNFLLFVVDASGSMGARGRMAASKGAIMSLLLDAYQKRDQVSMITFRRKEAMVNLPPTTSVDLAGKLLAEMPVGGRTPLSAGLAKSHEQVRNYLVKNPTGRPIVVFLTDGKCNVSLGQDKPVPESMLLASALARDERCRYIVVDTEDQGVVTFGLAQQLAGAMQAQYFKIDDLKAESLVNIVKGQSV